jgi:hypothetical protein
MVKTLVINNSNYVSGSNNKFIYNLPTAYNAKAGDRIGVSSISIYNSTYNIRAVSGNNTITLSIPWLSRTSTLTIPDGYYSISDLNNYIQAQCILLGWYLVNASSGSNIYFWELKVNTTSYGSQINFYLFPTAGTMPSGYTYATSGTSVISSYPASAVTGQMTFNTAFGSLIGLPGGTYPTTTQATYTVIQSTLTPYISPVNSYILTCNLVNSPYSIPNNILFSVPITGGFGSLIVPSIGSVIYNDISPAIYNSITITLYDQNFNLLNLLDNEMVLSLVIKSADEN